MWLSDLLKRGHGERFVAARQSTYQITFSIARIYQIPGICSGVVRESVSLPFCLIGGILGHDMLQLLNVHSSAINAITRTKYDVDIVDKLIEGIERFWRTPRGVMQRCWLYIGR